MSDKDEVGIILVIWCVLWAWLAMMLASVGGCAAVHGDAASNVAASNPVTHPIQNIQQAVATLQHGLTVLHVIGFLGAAISAGIFLFGIFSGDTFLERPALLGASVCGAIAALSLAGVILLPFAPWTLGVLAFAGVLCGGAEIYIKVQAGRAAKAASAPAVPTK